MNKRTSSDPELEGSQKPSESPAMPGQVSASRRQFAKAGAATPVVLGSLLSKPALATQAYNCTISGQMSGNASPRPGKVTCSTIGKSPGYWKNASSWPAGALKGDLPTGTCSFNTTTTTNIKGTVFGGFTSGGQTLVDAFRYKSASSVCNVYGSRDPSFSTCRTNAKATMLQVLNTQGGLNETMVDELGRATVATILNALSIGPDYPITVAQAIKMFNAVCPAGRKYQVNASVAWDDAKVVAYFKSLYS